MFINLTELKNVIPFVISARLPIMLRSKHGVGKSEIVKSFAGDVASMLYPDEQDRLKAYGSQNYIYPVVERRCSQMADAGDVMGLPFIKNETTEFHPMKWFHRACVEPCILFFDEVDRGPQDVRQALMQVSDSRTIANNVLHPDTIIFAAVNGGIGETAYQVGDFDPAELSRWMVFDLDPTVDEWLMWSKNRVVTEMYDFIKENRSCLEHKKEFEAGKVYPCRRSWDRFNKVISKSDLMNTDNKENFITLFHLAQASLGEDIAHLFTDFVKKYDKQVTIEDIVNKGKLDVIKKMDTGQQMAIIDKFEEHALFKKTLTKKQILNVSKFMVLISPELANRVWEIITRLSPENGITLYQVEGNELPMPISRYLGALNGAKIDENETP